MSDVISERGASAPRATAARGTDVPRSAIRSRRLARIIWVVAVLGVVAAIWFGFIRDRGPRDDLGKLQGDWNYSTAGRNNLGVIRVEGDVWSYHSGGPFGKSYRLTLRPEANPKEIDLALLGDDGQPVTFTHGAGKGGEVKLQGVYAFHGDQFEVAFGVRTRPATIEDDEAQVLVLTRGTK